MNDGRRSKREREKSEEKETVDRQFNWHYAKKFQLNSTDSKVGSEIVHDCIGTTTGHNLSIYMSILPQHSLIMDLRCSHNFASRKKNSS